MEFLERKDSHEISCLFLNQNRAIPHKKSLMRPAKVSRGSSSFPSVPFPPPSLTSSLSSSLSSSLTSSSTLPPSRHLENTRTTQAVSMTPSRNMSVNEMSVSSFEMLSEYEQRCVLFTAIKDLNQAVQHVGVKQDQQIATLIQLTAQAHSPSTHPTSLVTTWTSAQLRRACAPEILSCVPSKISMETKVEDCLRRLLRGKQVSLDVEEDARCRVIKWLRDYRSAKNKSARKAIKAYYWPAYGKPRLHTADEFNSELDSFNSRLPQDSEKVARVLGAIANSVWANHNPTEDQYGWLRDHVCEFIHKNGNMICEHEDPYSSGGIGAGEDDDV